MRTDNTFRVKELIQCLQNFPEDTPVYFKDDEKEDFFKIDKATLMTEVYPGYSKTDTFISLSYEDSVREYSYRKK